MIYSLFFFACAFLLCMFSTPWVIALSHRGIGLDKANENRKRHAAPIPRLGGAPIMFALSVCLLAILGVDPERASDWFPILCGSVLMFGLGLCDDLKPLGARKKLLGQIAIAILVYYLGLRVDLVSYPGAKWSVPLEAWSLPVTVFWLIAVPNIVNLIDGFDGLAGGLGLFMAVTLGIVGLGAEQLPVAWYAFSMAGALLGFLVFNFPPARIFLGDGGAYMIGFCIAALSLTSSHKGSIAAVLLVTIVALGVPILDTTFALLRRGIRGFPLFHADDEHIHHRLEAMGFSKRRVVLAIYGICVVLSLIGLSIFWSQGRTIPIAIGVVFLLAVFAARYLEYIGDWRDLHVRIERVIRRRRVVRYALLQAEILSLEVDRCGSAEEFWNIFEQTIYRVGFRPGKGDDCMELNVKYGDDRCWVLYAPVGQGSRIHWQRIAECFRSIYIKALSKWPPS